jgi:hypothetical protein
MLKLLMRQIASSINFFFLFSGFTLADAQATVPSHPAPFADIHIHFNWDQKEIISAMEVVHRLQAQNVRLTIVSSTPSELALELHQTGGDWIVPFFSPYITPASRRNWYLDSNVLTQAREGLSKKKYYGIGELHLMAGFPPRRDNPIVSGLMELAKELNVPVLIHVDAADPEYLAAICRKYPTVRFLLAHAGGIYSSDHIATLLKQFDNLWVELSARDPWRYGGITDEQGALLADWLNLLLRFPTRFMTGSDPVWSVRRTQHWDEPDEGWDHFNELLNFHRRWLQGLPPEVAEQIRNTNAQQFLHRN